MSAWVVEQEHIRVLIWAGLKFRFFVDQELKWYHDKAWHSLTESNASVIGKMLLKTNVDSVNFRYDEKSRTPTYKHRKPIHTSWSVGEIFKSIDCYTYQSCERDDWKDSEALAFCNALKDVLISKVPGYQDGPWGIGPDTVPAADQELG